ncbi:DUF4157 domain-containing protein [Moorena producens]|uniref:eCIS core domain-containing protein n=1 Tax=Moorena producens TaxID=1155739 RepID=UPI000A586832|nr:DUF4157 domain-containing protein [Moorena producens]
MTRQYARKTNQSPHKDADKWILQRTAVRSLPVKTLTPQTESPAGDRSGIQLDLTQIPVSDRSAMPVQAKLEIRPAGDKYELEADRVAKQVVQKLHKSQSAQLQQQPTLIRQKNPEVEKELQRKPRLQLKGDREGMTTTPELESSIARSRGSGQPIQRQAMFRGLSQELIGNWFDQNLVQAKLAIGEAGDKSELEVDRVGSPIIDQINPPIPNKTGLPDKLKAGVENLSGYALDDVRVHYNSPKPAQLQALAYTQGTEIHVAPGQEEHLPHETWHVVQQMQGRVKPTMQMKGVEINDDAGLEKEADIFGNKATQHPHANSRNLLKSDSTGTATIQCKGDKKLMTQLDPLLRWAMKKIGDARNYDPNLKALFKKINDYDRSQDGRPRIQDQEIVAMLIDLSNWLLANSQTLTDNDKVKHSQFKEILENEREVTDTQARRLEEYSAEPSSPYKQMTDEGMLWSQESFDHSTQKLGKTGKAYFEELSRLNVKSIKSDKSKMKLANEQWYINFVKAATEALSNAVVNHYTTSMRARAMLDGGGMKSKIMLEKDIPTFKHNTSPYDDLGLANSGFIFFFIESPNAPLRNTRFGGGDSNAEPARISIPIKESGLLENGWIMLSDFAQREYPNIVAKKGSDEHTSWLPTREKEQQGKKPDFTEKVREFKPGLSPLSEKDINEMSSMTDSEKIQAFSAVVPQASGDKDSKQIYTGANRTLEFPDRLFNNVLVAGDIIPGLANRAGLEVARIKEVNPALGEKFSKLRGDALMLLILKDLFRPQAMIPNSLKIKEEHIQPSPSAQNK